MSIRRHRLAKKVVRKVSVLPITKARVNLGAVVRRVHLNKEYIILEKGGIPVAGLMDADEMEDYLEVHDPKVQAQIRKSTEEYHAGKGRPAEEFLAELLQERGATSLRRRSAR
jgi:hypothetical protein